MNRKQIISRVAEVIALANKKFSLNMGMPTVEFYDFGRTAGWAHGGKHLLKFHEVLAKQNSKDFDDVVIHEVGHLVTRRLYDVNGIRTKSHGPEFKRVTRALGGSANRTHSMDTTGLGRKITRHEVKCSCRTHMVTTRILNTLSTRWCRACKGKLTPTGKVVTQ